MEALGAHADSSNPSSRNWITLVPSSHRFYLWRTLSLVSACNLEDREKESKWCFWENTEALVRYLR
jgi:hypothetical protein